MAAQAMGSLRRIQVFLDHTRHFGEPRDLMDRVQEQPVDFEGWYVANHARVVASVLLATGDVDLTRDAVDEAFTRALVRWDRVKEMDSPTGWTYKVALNAARRHERRRALERRLLARRALERSVPAPAGEAWALVRGLPRRQRTVVVLRYVADLTQAQIAEVMGISRSTVASTLVDAHRRLGRLLADEDHDDNHDDNHDEVEVHRG
jgi:RNA polymerase sigma-70 factor (ECF subfamily)